jgi:hypothetical protein
MSLFGLVMMMISVLLLLSVGSVLWLSKHRSEAYQEQVLEKAMSQMGHTIIEKTTQYLMPAIIVAESSARFAQTGIVSFDQSFKTFERLETYLMSQIK